MIEPAKAAEAKYANAIAATDIVKAITIGKEAV